jgi:hypothetical protein
VWRPERRLRLIREVRFRSRLDRSDELVVCGGLFGNREELVPVARGLRNRASAGTRLPSIGSAAGPAPVAAVTAARRLTVTADHGPPRRPRQHRPCAISLMRLSRRKTTSESSSTRTSSREWTSGGRASGRGRAKALPPRGYAPGRPTRHRALAWTAVGASTIGSHLSQLGWAERLSVNEHSPPRAVRRRAADLAVSGGRRQRRRLGFNDTRGLRERPQLIRGEAEWRDE